MTYECDQHLGQNIQYKNGPSKIFRRQPLKNLKGYGLVKHLLV